MSTLAARVKEILDRPCVQITILLVQIGLAIYSIVSIVTAYQALAAREADVGNSVDNWLTAPIVDVSFVPVTASLSQACPSSYPITMQSITFAGVAQGLCSCDANAHFIDDGRRYDESSSQSSCSTNQTKAGCEDDPSIGPIRMPLWDDNLLICGRRSGVGAVISRNPYLERPLPVEGQCPSGYRVCGTGITAICFPTTSGLCPVTSMAQSTVAPSTTYGANYTRLTSGTYLVADRIPTSLPVVETTIGFRGICFGKTDAYGYDQATANLPGNRAFSDSCSVDKDDGRWTAFTSTDERAFVQKHFALSPDWCGATANQPALQISGPCSSSDSICLATTSRTRCEKLTKYTEGPSSEGPVTIFVRNEISWKADCAITREELMDAAIPLSELVDFQGIVVAINITTNVINMLIYINLILNLWLGNSPCCPMKGEQEKALLKVLKTWVDTSAKIIRIVPLGILTSGIYRVLNFWQETASQNCSDSVTNDTMIFLAKTLNNLLLSNISTIVIDCIMLFISLITIVRTYFCGKNPGDPEDGADGTKTVPEGTTEFSVRNPSGPPVETEGAPVV